MGDYILETLDLVKEFSERKIKSFEIIASCIQRAIKVDAEIIITADIPQMDDQYCVISNNWPHATNIVSSITLQNKTPYELCKFSLFPFLEVPYLSNLYIRIHSDQNIGSNEKTIIESIIEDKLGLILNYRREQIRRQVISISQNSSDINSFYHKISTQIVQNNFNVEACSIYTYDTSSKFLRLGGTTGIDSDLEKKDIYYEPHRANKIRKAFIDRDMVLLQTEGGLKRGRYPENITSGDLYSVIYFPMLTLPSLGLAGSMCYGVLKVCNPRSNSSKGQKSFFHAVDIYELFYLSEYISVLSQNYIRSMENEFNLERLIHGLEANLGTAITNLHGVSSTLFPKINEIKYVNFLVKERNFLSDKELQVLMGDARLLLDDLAFQIQKATEVSSSNLEIITHFHSDILMPMLKLEKAILKANSSLPLSINNFKVAGSFDIPPIIANKAGLVSVFRNLLENSIKYRKMKERPQVTITFDFDRDDEFVYIHFSDAGIGIDAEEAQYLFTEKFRSDKAKVTSNRGHGIGLHYCKRTLTQWGGDIYNVPQKVGMEFVIKIKRAYT